MSAEIVSLSAARTVRANPVLMQVEAYWDGLRNGRPAPSRAEVDPRGLSGVLAHCFILERIAPGMARFRVCGQEIANLMGLEMRGLPFTTLFLPEARDILEDSLERVFATPMITRFTVASPADFKRQRIEGQMLLLPLKSDLGDISRVLGCLSMSSTEGARPRRLGIEATAPREIPTGRSFHRDLVAPAPQAPVPTDAAGEIIRLPLPAE